MSTFRHATLVLAGLLSFLALGPRPAHAQGTTFTYQVNLANGGTPGNGLHDFRFRLFDAASDGTQLGTTVCIDNVTVLDGVFTVEIDFGQPCRFSVHPRGCGRLTIQRGVCRQ